MTTDGKIQQDILPDDVTKGAGAVDDYAPPIREHQLLMYQRQLLAMERKRASTSKATAIEEVRHFHRQLGNLLQLQATLLASKSRLDALVLPDLADLARRSERAWLHPDLKLTRAWKLWFEEEKTARAIPLRIRRPDRKRVAFVLGGGIGDLLKASVTFPALRHVFNCDLYVFADNSIAAEILSDNPFVDRTTILTRNPHSFALDCLHHIALFDLVVSWRYAVTYCLPPQSRFDTPAFRAMFKRYERQGQDYQKYYFRNFVWPVFNNGFGRDMVADGHSVIGVSGATSGLTIDRNSPIPFFPSKSSLCIIAPHRDRPYVTVHHGFDPNHLPDRTTTTSYGSTKNISTAVWKQIIAAITAMGLDVIQLGTTNEEALPGASYVYNGQTTFAETAMLIKRAVCHVDTEGGLVHVARAVHTRSVVLFGPTPVGVFGYDQNINLEPQGCKACWYTTQNWVVQCPRLTRGPDCMAEHRSHTVLSSIREIVDDAVRVELEIGDPSLANLDTFAQMLGEPSSVDRKRLLIMTDGPTDEIVHHLEAVSTPLDVTNIVISRDGGKLTNGSLAGVLNVAASPYNLPHESGSIDAVLVKTRDWYDEGDHVLREVSRVLKRGGILLGIPFDDLDDGEVRPFDLARAMRDSGITLHSHSIARAAHDGAFMLTKVVRQPESWATGYGLAAEMPDTTKPQRRAAQEFPCGDDDLLARLRQETAAERSKIGKDLAIVADQIVRQETIDDKIWHTRQEISRLRSGTSDWIEASIAEGDTSAENFLASGWGGPESWGVWGEGSTQTLLLPIPAIEASRDGALEVELLCVLYRAQGEGQTTLQISVEGVEIARFEHDLGEMTAKVFVPRSHLRFASVAKIDLQSHFAIGSASQIGLIRFRYRMVDEPLKGFFPPSSDA